MLRDFWFFRSAVTVCVEYLTSRTLLDVAHDVLSGQVNQDVGAVIVHGHIIPVKCDYTQIRDYRAAA